MELDEVSVAGIVCPPYEDQGGARGTALFLMSSANDVIRGSGIKIST